jgi:hypothetical protein
MKIHRSSENLNMATTLERGWCLETISEFCGGTHTRGSEFHVSPQVSEICEAKSRSGKRIYVSNTGEWEMKTDGDDGGSPSERPFEDIDPCRSDGRRVRVSGVSLVSLLYR